MSYDGLFLGWTIDQHTATSPCGRYCLWIPSGRSFFRDYGPRLSLTLERMIGSEPFLAGLSWWTRQYIWRELKREQRRRAVGRVEAFMATRQREVDEEWRELQKARP